MEKDCGFHSGFDSKSYGEAFFYIDFVVAGCMLVKEIDKYLAVDTLVNKGKNNILALLRAVYFELDTGKEECAHLKTHRSKKESWLVETVLPSVLLEKNLPSTVFSDFPFLLLDQDDQLMLQHDDLQELPTFLQHVLVSPSHVHCLLQFFLG